MGQAARRINPKLKEIVAEASSALARLDAERLEELARSCEALNRGLGAMSKEEKAKLSEEAREATADLFVFGRVLEVTRGNVNAMKKLRELRVARLEYSERQARGAIFAEARNGNR